MWASLAGVVTLERETVELSHYWKLKGKGWMWSHQESMKGGNQANWLGLWRKRKATRSKWHEEETVPVISRISFSNVFLRVSSWPYFLLMQYTLPSGQLPYFNTTSMMVRAAILSPILYKCKHLDLIWKNCSFNDLNIFSIHSTVKWMNQTGI